MPLLPALLVLCLSTAPTAAPWVSLAAEPEVAQAREQLRATYKRLPPFFFKPQPPPPPPPPRQTATTAARSHSAAVEQWRGLVAQYFPAEHVEAALRVLACESRGDPGIVNEQGSSAAGLFQFLRDTWNRVAVPLGYGDYDSGAVFDPVANAHAASVLSKGGTTWRAWSCKP